MFSASRWKLRDVSATDCIIPSSFWDPGATSSKRAAHWKNQYINIHIQISLLSSSPSFPAPTFGRKELFLLLERKLILISRLLLFVCLFRVLTLFANRVRWRQSAIVVGKEHKMYFRVNRFLNQFGSLSRDFSFFSCKKVPFWSRKAS